jgi:hypothetical protein
MLATVPVAATQAAEGPKLVEVAKAPELSQKVRAAVDAAVHKDRNGRPAIDMRQIPDDLVMLVPVDRIDRDTLSPAQREALKDKLAMVDAIAQLKGQSTVLSNRFGDTSEKLLSNEAEILRQRFGDDK